MGSNQQVELEALGNDALTLYSRATKLRQLRVAEELLQALEELASSAPECDEILYQAYAQIAHLRSHEMPGGRTR